MNDNGLDTGEQPYDDRHAPAPRFEDGAEEIREGEDQAPRPNPFSLSDAPPPMTWQQPQGLPQRVPSRVHGRPLIHEQVREHGIPAFGAGLNWQASVQSPVRADLVTFDFAKQGMSVIPGPEVSNIELRTIYAHLLETAGRVRAEMRERGMQVDL